MKIVWQYKQDVSCLDVVLRLLTSKVSSNQDCIKIMKKSMAILYAFCQEQKNQQISKYFTDHQAMIFHQICLPQLANNLID